MLWQWHQVIDFGALAALRESGSRADVAARYFLSQRLRDFDHARYFWPIARSRGLELYQTCAHLIG